MASCCNWRSTLRVLACAGLATIATGALANPPKGQSTNPSTSAKMVPTQKMRPATSDTKAAPRLVVKGPEVPGHSNPPGSLRGPADECAAAVAIAIGGSVTLDTTTATNGTAGDGVCLGSPGDGSNDSWMTFVGDGTTLSITTCGGAGWDTVLKVYSGGCGGLTCVGANDDNCGLQSRVTFPSTAGTTYHARLSGFGAASGAATITLTSSGGGGGPANDNCGGAILVPVPGSALGDTTTATVDAAPACGGGITGNGVWYKFIGTGDTINVSTCSANTLYDTKIHVYKDGCAVMTCVGGNDDDGVCTEPGFSPPGWRSTVAVPNSIPGSEYLVLVEGFSAADFGPFELILAVQGPCTIADCPPGGTPENEPDCGVPTDTVNGGCNSNPPVFTNLVCGQTYCGSGTFDQSIGFRDTDWYQIVLTAPTEMTWTVNSAFPFVIGFVENAGVPDCAIASGFLNPFAVGSTCSSATVTLCANPGTYWAFVAPQFVGGIPCPSNYNATMSCAACSPPPPPANDECATAEVITCGQNVTADTTNATNNPADPAFSCGFFGPSPGAGSVWYRFTATDTTARVGTCGSAGGDSLLAVYTGSCGSLVEVGCNDDTCGLLSRVCIDTVPGQQYYIQLARFNAAMPAVFDLLVQCPCPPAPANDECAGAVPVALGTAVSGDTSDASDSADGDCASAGNASPDLWYSFVGNGNGVTLDTCTGTTFDTVIAVYTGACGALACLADNDQACGNQSSLLACTNAGETYYVRVGGWLAGDTGVFTLTLTDSGPCTLPGNDLCSGAETLAVPGSVSSSTQFATNGAEGDGCGFVGDGSNDVWYTFVGSGNSVTLDTCTGTTYDSAISVYSGSCGALVCGVGNDDFCGLQSQTTFCAVSGTTYFVRISGFGLGNGAFTLNATMGGSCALPPNDECSNATAMTVPGTVSGDTTGATNSAEGGCATAGNASPDVWYSFSVPSSTEVTLDTCSGTTFDTVIAVYTGSCASLSCVADNDQSCGNQSSVTFCAAGGVTYTVRVGGWLAADVGAFSMNATTGAPCTPPVPPANDACANAQVVTPGTYSGSTALAGNDGTATCGATAGTRDVWFSYTAPGNCNLTIDTCGSGYDTVLSIHSACPGSGANQLACNDDAPAGSCAGTLQSYITIPVTAGTTYIIRLGGFGGAFGPFTLNVADDCVAFTDCNQNAQNDAAEIAANPALDCFTRTAAPINGFHRMGGPNGTIDACECVANFNRDGAVGTSDISAMLSSWFNDISTGQLKADINCSGSIGTNDVSGFLTIWFNSLNGQPVYQNCP